MIPRSLLGFGILIVSGPLITLTTDFGTDDAYVAIMKAVILQRCPAARFADITHAVAAQDVMQGAYLLRTAAPFFPAGTIHLAVIDPGVGTARKAIALRKGKTWFIGPDNGLFALVLGDDAPDELVELDRPAFWQTSNPSPTFHGRDIFAPAAAHLAAGRTLAEIGTPLNALTTLHWAHPIADNRGIRGSVLHIDRFGNCITNIPQVMLHAYRRERPFKCYVGSDVLQQHHATYSAVPRGEPLLLTDSQGYLEIAVHGGNAADLLSIRRGAHVTFVFQDER
ncbi:MAG: SAM-dependent chlorinase/fluorinase [Bacteroidota bacterium]